MWGTLDDSTKTSFVNENGLVLWGYTVHVFEPSCFTTTLVGNCLGAREARRGYLTYRDIAGWWALGHS